jgi:ArsR family transcriptional regulator, arsenate/arsenite/antimonite-responsive transcriptional repressor
MSRTAEPSATAKSNLRKWSAQIAALLKACADPTRVRLLNLLAREGEVCVCHLVDVLETNQPKVSRHLAYLKRVGLVKDRKDGLWVHYRLSSTLGEHAQRLIACLNSCAAEVPEMQGDVDTLRRIRTAQPLVKLARKPRAATLQTEPQAEERPAARYEQEIQVELL